jgi:hypothetical protein
MSTKIALRNIFIKITLSRLFHECNSQWNVNSQFKMFNIDPFSEAPAATMVKHSLKKRCQKFRDANKNCNVCATDVLCSHLDGGSKHFSGGRQRRDGHIMFVPQTGMWRPVSGD